MKTRTALVYLTVFLLLAGYFYYFEVVRREARHRQEEAARQLFQVDKDQITALKLDRADGELISLQKNGRWLIVEPLSTRADASTVAGLLTALQSIKLEREVKPAAEHLKPFGLDDPKFQLSFLAAGTWHNLRLGSKAAVGDAFYASGDQENRVVLISASNQRGLDKSLFDLRSKDLFTLKSEDINRIEIEHPDGKLALARTEKKRWQASPVPDLKIKASKVENLLNRLVWLRASRFLDHTQDNAAELGLDPARIQIRLSAKEKTQSLLLGNTRKDEGIYAKTVELPGVALVDENLLKELPSKWRDLEDRTLFAFDLDQIRVLVLEGDGETGRLERDGEKWKWTGDSHRPNPENWLVNSLLWKIQDLEYLPEHPPQKQSPPEQKQLKLVLYSENDNELGTFALAEVPSENRERGIVWFLKGGETPRPHFITAAALQDLHKSVKRLLTHESIPPSR